MVQYTDSQEPAEIPAAMVRHSHLLCNLHAHLDDETAVVPLAIHQSTMIQMGKAIGWVRELCRRNSLNADGMFYVNDDSVTCDAPAVQSLCAFIDALPQLDNLLSPEFIEGVWGIDLERVSDHFARGPCPSYLMVPIIDWCVWMKYARGSQVGRLLRCCLELMCHTDVASACATSLATKLIHFRLASLTQAELDQVLTHMPDTPFFNNLTSTLRATLAETRTHATPLPENDPLPCSRHSLVAGIRQSVYSEVV